ncbi:MAG: choice-of-anchor J domain-containing protein [Candidatus Aphodosoma sp.]
MNLPYSETCGNSELDCWNQESNGSSNWAFANYNGSRYYLQAQYLGTTDTVCLLSPVFKINGYDLTVTVDGQNSVSTADTVNNLYYSVDSGISYTALSGSCFYPSVRGLKQFVIPNTNVGIIQFKIVGNLSAAGQLSFYGFAVEENLPCSKPQSVNISVSNDTAVVHILDSINSHNQWQYVCGQGDFDISVKQPITVDSIFELTGLNFSNSYNIYVRTDCGGSYSNWVGPFSFMTSCGVTSLPYRQNFENVSANTEFKGNCINIISENQGNVDGLIAKSSSVPYVDLVATTTFASNKGLNAIKFASSADYNIYYYLPEIYTPINYSYLSFNYYYQSSSSVSRLVVGIMKEDMPATFIDLYECPYTGAGINDNIVRLDFGKIMPSGDYADYRIAFKYSAGTHNAMASIDDVVVTEKDKCSESPVIKLTDANTNSVSFFADYYADSLMVKWGNAGTTLENCTSVLLTDSNAFVIGNLVSGTPYDVYVRTICASGNGYWVGPYTVTTTCDAIVVDEQNPWRQDFDLISSANYSMPSCMSILLDASLSGIVYPNVQTINNDNVLVMKEENIVALPLFDRNANEYHVSFYAKGRGSVAIGAVDKLNADDFKEAVKVSADDEYNYFDIDLSTYNIDGKYISLKSTLGSEITIDSLVVYYAPSCFSPRFLNVDYYDDNTASISFVLPTETDFYEYYLISDNDTIQNRGEEVIKSVAFNDLQPNTQYSFGIRNICGVDTSEWSEISFTTYAISFKAPFVLNFENDSLNAYLKYNSDIDNYFIVGSDANAVKAGNKALYITNDSSSYQHTVGIVRVSYVSIPVILTEGTYLLSYDWKAQGEYSQDYGRVFLAPADMNFSASELYAGLSANTVPSGCYPLDNNAQLLLSNGWNSKTIEWTESESCAKNIVIMWRTGTSGVNPPLSVDNITLNKFDCVEKVASVNIISVGEDSVAFSVENNPLLLDSIQYQLLDEGGVCVATYSMSNVNGTPYVISNLNADADYSLVVSGYCDDGISNWQIVHFHTLCMPIQVSSTSPYSESFENLPSGSTFADNFHCWNYSNTGSSYLRLLQSSSLDLAQKAHSGSQAMSLLYNNKVEITGKFEIEQGNYELSLFAINSVAKAEVLVLAKLRTDNIWDTLRIQNINDYYEPIAVQLNVPVTAVYDICFVLNNTIATTGYLTVDDINIKSANVVRPTQVEIYDVYYNKANVKWYSNTNCHRVQLLDSMQNEVLDTIVYDITDFRFNNLVESMKYQVVISSISGNDSSNTVCNTFVTLCAPVESYSEDFESYDNLTRPSCWEIQGYKSNGEKYVMPENDLQWEISQVGNQKGLMLHNSAATRQSTHILYSPVFSIGNQSVVSFDYYNNTTLDTLKVTIVNENNVESSTILEAIPNQTNSNWSQFSLDLTEYNGQNIRVKFISRTSQSMNSTYVGVDNFNLSCRVDGGVINDVACAGTNYSDNGFNIPSSQYVVGDTLVRTRIVSGENGDCDTVYTLNLYVPQTIYTTIYDTICEGDIYNNGQFINLSVENRYVETYTSSLGCDSVVTLFLNVIDRDVNISHRICEGDSYYFAGKFISQSGVYRDTTLNSKGCDSVTILTLIIYPKYYETNVVVCEGTEYTWNDTVLSSSGSYSRVSQNVYGCDSISIINFTVIPTNTYVTATICQGQNFEFGDEILTEAGNYERTMSNSLLCDSIIHLTLIVTDPKESNIEDYVCEGQPYYGNGFSVDTVTQDTILTKVIHTIDGCDSIVTVSLQLFPTIYLDTVVTINEGEVYEFAGNTYSIPGTYEGHFYTKDYGCDSIVTLTLNVITAVETNSILPIIIAPNPILGGQSTFVVREWTAEEQEGMRVEVLSAEGQLVDTIESFTYPIEIKGNLVSGIYIIRIISGTGDVYVSRLVVK